MSDAQRGIAAAILTPVFLGMAPVLGKMALKSGADPFTVAAVRTALVAILLWTIYLIFWRRFIFIYPAGLIACFAIGFTNGIGSLFYYSGLDRLDASVAQLLNATYVIFVVLLTRIAGTRIRARTVLRVLVALFGVFLITGGLTGDATWLGVGLMLGNALLFAGTVVMSQRILFEMPPPTVTLYVMTAMATVVVIARGVASPTEITVSTDAGWAIIALAITTALSRISLFTGIKGVGSLQAALTAIGEGAVAASLAFLLLDESLNTIQWLGVGALVASLFIPGQRSDDETTPVGGSLPNVAGMRFRRMANAEEKFSTQEMQNIVNLVVGPVDKLTTQELKELRQLIGDDAVQKLKDLEARSFNGDS